MKKIILKSFLVICFCITQAAYAATTAEVKQNIIYQAKAMGVEPAIVLSIAKTESGFNQNARGYGGHVGVFQLSPATAKTMGYNPYDLNQNIKAGITYYKNMYQKFGTKELAVAAYNSGPGAVTRNGNTIPSNSKHFVSKIMKDYNAYKAVGL